MHMRRHGNAVLPMGFHGQDIHRENLAGLGIGLPDSGLLLCLPHCHRQKVIDAVGVTARPRKGIVDVVVHHQHLGERRIHHETGTGDVPVLALPIQHTAAVLPHGLHHLLQIPPFRILLRQVGSKAFLPVRHIDFPHHISHGAVLLFRQHRTKPVQCFLCFYYTVFSSKLQENGADAAKRTSVPFSRYLMTE